MLNTLQHVHVHAQSRAHKQRHRLTKPAAQIQTLIADFNKVIAALFQLDAFS